VVGLHRTFSEKQRVAVFEQLARELGGRFINHEGWQDDRVIIDTPSGTVTIDIIGEAGWHMEHHATRIRAIIDNPSRLRFHVYSAAIGSRIGRLLGMEDIPIGDGMFDRAYVVQANKPEKIQQVLADDQVRERLLELGQIDLSIRGFEGGLEQALPAGRDYLELRFPGVIGEVGEIRAVFDLFVTVLRATRSADIAPAEDDGSGA
jgi:hypothetical protein